MSYAVEFAQHMMNKKSQSNSSVYHSYWYQGMRSTNDKNYIELQWWYNIAIVTSVKVSKFHGPQIKIKDPNLRKSHLKTLTCGYLLHSSNVINIYKSRS